MAHSLGLLVAAASLRLAYSSNAHIDASGVIVSAPRHEAKQEDGVGDMVAMIKEAKETMRRTRKTASLVRTEVRRHLPDQLEEMASGSDLEMRRAHLEKAMGLLEVGEVDCVGSSEQKDPVSGKLCLILHGTNSQVAGKLERAVKGLSLRPKTPNATQMVVADRDEDHLLTHLKAALWELWFCAKRAEPACDPLTTDDKKVKEARETAFDALHAIHTHAEDHGRTQPSATKAAGTGAAAAAATKADGVLPVEAVVPAPSPSSLIQKDAVEIQADSIPTCMAGCNGDLCALYKKDPKPCGTKCTADQDKKMSAMCTAATAPGPAPPSPVPTAASTRFATRTLDRMMSPPNATGKLWDAINGIDIDDVLQKDIIRITEDEDGNMKKLKANMLLLHECSTMPDCPATGCCNPSNPTQAVYVQARNDAYIAYHNIMHDDNLAKQAYLDLLGNIGAGKTTTFPPGHPRHGKHHLKAHHAHHSKKLKMVRNFTILSCRHKTYNDTADPKRMTTGEYCADMTADTADATGNALTAKKISTCETWDCSIMPGNKSTCNGKFYASATTCSETNHTSSASTNTVPKKEGVDILLIAISVITLTVLGAIAFLVVKTQQASKKEPDAAAGGAEGEWGAEGYGEGQGQGYGQY